MSPHTIPMETTMAKQPDNGGPKTSDHIEQIRDIIFGPQKREYDERFEQVIAEIRRSRSDSSARMDELRASLEERMTAGMSALDQAIRQLSARVDSETTHLQKQLDKAEQKLNTDIAALTHRVDQENSALRHDIADSRSKLQAEMRNAREELTKNLDTQSSELRETKVSRDVMAEMLQEVAMKLKGVEVLEELKKAARKKPGE